MTPPSQGVQRILALLVLVTLCGWCLPRFLQKAWWVLGMLTSIVGGLLALEAFV
jgi:hypothetical protein